MNAQQIHERIHALQEQQLSVPLDAEDRESQLDYLEGRVLELMEMREQAIIEEGR